MTNDSGIQNIMNSFLMFCVLCLMSMSVAMAGDAPHSGGKANRLWTQILRHRVTYIQDGTHGPVIYDVQDPNCPYCHVLYENEIPLIESGKLTVRYIPVAILTPGSLGEAAAWLQAPHPLFALQHFENIVGDAFRSENTTTLPTVTASASTRIKLHDNLLIIRSLGVTGTPAIIYRTEHGRIKIIMGLISRHRLVSMLPYLK